MRNTLTVVFLSVAVAGSAQISQPESESAGESRGLLSRLRGNGPSTRQQIQNPAIEVAQPAAAPQGYRPGVTFPQQQAQQQQAPPQQQYPAYPPYNMPGQPYYPQQQQQPVPGRPTPTPTPTPASSQRSSSSSSDDDSSNRGSRSSSSSSRSGSQSSGSSTRSSSSSSNASKSSSGSDSDSKPKSAASSSAKSEDSAEKKATSSSSSDSGSKSSALEKIAKKVESGKADDDKQAEPKKTKEEIEIERAREAALKAADKATTVVANFLQQANDGYYSKAADQLAPTIQKYFQSEMSAVSGTQKAVLDELTANGTITMVTYVNRIVRGEGAEVEAELVYEDGRTVRRTFDLIEIGDDWKIVLPVTPGATAASVTNVPAAAATPTPQPVAPPPSAEQAAANAPMVLVPGTATSDEATTSPQ